MSQHSTDLSRFEKDLIWARQHDGLENPVERALVRAWELGAADAQIEGMIESSIYRLRKQEAVGELTPFRRPRLADGEIVLGKERQGGVVRILLQWLAAGLLILANTGSGKSTLLIALALQIATTNCQLWISDLYKTQMRHLAHAFWRLGKRLVILGPGQWKFNLLDPGPLDPARHLATVIDLLVRLLDLPPRARSILREGGYALYERFGIWQGRRDAFPCLFDLYEWVRSTPGLNAAAREAILDRLGCLLTSLTPAVAAFRRGWSPVDLARHSIVFEMLGASETVKQLLLGSTLFSVFAHEVGRGAVNSPLSLLIAIEDGQRFLRGASADSGGEIAPIDELAAVVRGAGIGIAVLAQTLEGLSRTLIPNLATKVMGRLGSHDDYHRLGADMGMNAAQIDWARRNLKPGVFIGQASEGDSREAFVFQVPRIALPCTVTDEQAAASVRALDGLPVVAAPEFARWAPRYVIEVPAQVSAEPPSLSQPELAYLDLIVTDPGKASSVYARQIGMSGKRAAEMRRGLVERGYLREHAVATAGRGRNAIVLEPLDAARAAVNLGGKGE